MRKKITNMANLTKYQYFRNLLLQTGLTEDNKTRYILTLVSVLSFKIIFVVLLRFVLP